MNYFNNIAINEKGQMMTIEAFLGALLIITAVLFVVSQAPSGVQQADAQSKTQLMHYGEDTIDMLKNSPPPSDKPDYDNNLQYYFSEKKFDDLNEFLNDTLPDNVVYNVELYDGGRYLPIIRNGYPSANGISFNEIIITKGAPAGGVGNLTGTYITNKSFDNGSLIIPMDKQQNNNITAYNLILNISDLGIPVYQLLMDPRKEYAGDTLVARLVKINTTTEPWGDEESYGVNDYYGGPYVVDAADLTPIIENQIRDYAENPIQVPSCKIYKIEFNNSMTSTIINMTFNLSDGSKRIVNIPTSNFDVTINEGYNDSKYLEIDTSSIAFDDLNNSKIIGIVIFNKALYDLTISNITIDWLGNTKLLNITIDGTDCYVNSNSPAKNILGEELTLAHNDSSKKVTVHKSVENFNYTYTTWLTGRPRIAVYPKDGTMRNYYSDSGISYTVFGNGNILNGDLRNCDILIMPHTSITETKLSNDSVVENIIKWVSDGGVLLAECDSIKEIDDRVEAIDQDNHTWYGFIGIDNIFNTTATIQFIGIGTGKGNFEYINLSQTNGSYLHPLAQSYTKNGALPGTNGTISAFWLNGTLMNGNINLDNSIMAVPQGIGDGGLGHPKVTFVEAPFDKGTVIYLAGHDQSTFSQQRKRLIFNSILYSTTAKVYSYGLLEIRITMWYK
ncbi:MAG: hypothetical protein K8R08_08585 [Methanosarcinales archaeon]|nr:hypothetical protein [Methanosarcinales archaeon]